MCGGGSVGGNLAQLPSKEEKKAEHCGVFTRVRLNHDRRVSEETLVGMQAEWCSGPEQSSFLLQL